MQKYNITVYEETELEKKLPSLEVRLLGHPEVMWNGHLLAIPRRQARALLFYLASQPEPAPREHLCTLFWADFPTTQARRNLSRLLNHLRNSLPDQELLLTTEDQVSLDPERVLSDVLEFERLYQDAKATNRMRALEKAIGLYRKPFLDGVVLPETLEYEAWVSNTQQACERTYLESLVEVVEDHARRGDFSQAITYARRYLEVDELAEELHRRLIELYALSGDRRAALRQYEECITVLERELGVDPLPETTAIYRAVLEGGTPEMPSTPQDSWIVLPGISIPMVGRQAESRCLDQTYAGTRRGRGRVVWVTGEPGIGKTRLLQDFIARYQGETQVLVGRACADTQLHPYFPIVQALRPALKDKAVLKRIPTTWLAKATHLFPELREHLPSRVETNLPSENRQARAHLFEALRQVVLALADGPLPLVFCLDDLQWCDRTTLDWLAYLAQSLVHSRVLVVASCSSADSEWLEPLRRQLWRLGCLTEIPLSTLDEEEILQLIVYLIDPTLATPRLVTRLMRVTNGNPFFLLEILRLLINSGKLSEGLSDLEAIPIPDTVKQAVESHLEHLSPVAHQVLEAASVLLPTITFNLLTLTPGRSELETAEALDELVARQLLVEENGGYRFLHRIIRSVVYQGISSWRCRLLHQRAAQALRTTLPNELAALVWHYQRAEKPGLAALFAFQTGEEEIRVFAYSEALHHFDIALACLEQELPNLIRPDEITANHRLQIQVLEARCGVHQLKGEMCNYEADLHEATVLAKKWGDQKMLASLCWREAAEHKWFARYDQACQVAENGIEKCRANGDLLSEALCWRELGMAARTTGNYTRAEHALTQALAGFTHVGDTVYQIHTLGNLSTLSLKTGDLQRAQDLARQALVLCDQEELLQNRRLPLGDLGAVALAQGNLVLAQSYLEECLHLSRRVGDRTQEIFAMGHLGWLMLADNHPNQAKGWFESALELTERIDSKSELPWLQVGLAETERLAGQSELACAHVKNALKSAQLTGRTYEENLASHTLEQLAVCN